MCLGGFLHWLNKSNGRFTARSRISNNAIFIQPIVSNELLFAYSVDGTLAAYYYTNKAVEDLSEEVLLEQSTFVGESPQQAAKLRTKSLHQKPQKNQGNEALSPATAADEE